MDGTRRGGTGTKAARKPGEGTLEPIYLDHAATTSVRPEVRDAMMAQLAEGPGNPSSIHGRGRRARNALEEARERVAAVLGAHRREIVFTSGGTEADNIAVLGCWRAAREVNGGGPVVCSAIEHKAVLGAAAQAGREGATPILLGVDSDGRVDAGALDEAVRARPCVVSVMWGNNEVGTIQPVRRIAESCVGAGIPFHSDAVQAFGKVRVRMDEVPCSLLALSAHKFGGPRGTGVLFVRDGVELQPLLYGGGQERELRPGTEDVASAVGLTVAAELAAAEQEAEASRLIMLRDRLEAGLRAALPGITVHGGGAERLPHVCSIAVPEVDPEVFLIGLDLDGLAVSGGSACQSGAGGTSHVLLAMGAGGAETPAATVRLSLGRDTTGAELDTAIEIVARVAGRARTAAVAR